MVQLMPLSLASVKSTLVLPFWYRLTWVVLDKGLLNGCVCVCMSGIVLAVRLSSSAGRMTVCVTRDQRISQDVDRMTRTFSTIVADLLMSPFTIAFYTCSTWARCVLHLHDVGQVSSTPAPRGPGEFYTCTTWARCVLHLHHVGQVRFTPAPRGPGAFHTCTTWAR